MQKYEIPLIPIPIYLFPTRKSFRPSSSRSIMPLGKRYTAMKNICLRQNFMNA